MNKTPLFHAILTPHRSIGASGIRWVVGIYAALAMIPALYFFFSGAWPIIGFLGLDALALWWALSASKNSEKNFEEVILWPDSLQIRRVTARGKKPGRQSFESINPFWFRLHLDRDHDEQIVSIRLVNQQKSFEIGSFLTPDDKTKFASLFSNALARSKN